MVITYSQSFEFLNTLCTVGSKVTRGKGILSSPKSRTGSSGGAVQAKLGIRRKKGQPKNKSTVEGAMLDSNLDNYLKAPYIARCSAWAILGLLWLRFNLRDRTNNAQLSSSGRIVTILLICKDPVGRRSRQRKGLYKKKASHHRNY